MTYARARLWLGITNVGFHVTLACVLLAIAAPQRWIAAEAGTWSLVAFVAGACLLSLPFDAVGGLVLPRRHGRGAPSTVRWLMSWARGTASYAVLLCAFGSVILAAGRFGGITAAFGAFLVASVLLVLAQEWVARAIARRPGCRDLSDERVLWVDCDEDPSFTGGVSRFPGRGLFVLPAVWRETLSQQEVDALLKRRQLAVERGLWTAGMAAAILWNGAGFFLASLIPAAGVDSVAGLVTLSLGFTLWSFIGLLLLPTASRRAVFALDQLALHSGVPEDVLRTAIGRLDRMQDDEPHRARWVERVFHPIPSVSRRLDRLARPERIRGGTWNVARAALFLSWAGLGLLGRAVHCNVGRPMQWVYLPVD